MSYARLFRDIAEGYQIDVAAIAHWTMDQLYMACCDKEKVLPKRRLPKGRVLMTQEDIIGKYGDEAAKGTPPRNERPVESLDYAEIAKEMERRKAALSPPPRQAPSIGGKPVERRRRRR